MFKPLTGKEIKNKYYIEGFPPEVSKQIYEILDK